MAEERMLNDEILLGLIKANSGGGGGGTTDYSDLSNKPQINSVTLSGNKSASDLGLATAAEVEEKQDALTAGTNINMTGNVLKAGVVEVVEPDMTVYGNSTESGSKTYTIETTGVYEIFYCLSLQSTVSVTLPNDANVLFENDLTVSSHPVKHIVAELHEGDTVTIAQTPSQWNAVVSGVLKLDAISVVDVAHTGSIADSTITYTLPNDNKYYLVVGACVGKPTGNNAEDSTSGGTPEITRTLTGSGVRFRSVVVKGSDSPSFSFYGYDGGVASIIAYEIEFEEGNWDYSLATKNYVDTALSGKQDTLTFDSVPTDGSTNPVESNGVYDALATKQDTTDNNLQTTAKTVVGGINELNSNLTSVEEWVNADAKTVTGNPITITDAANVNAKALSMTVEPIQDLHGYDKPWVGGAGKNKLPMTVDGIKALNTTGTWSGNVYTINGGTFEILTDSDENVIGVKANGTFSTETAFQIIDPVNFPAGSYKYGCASSSLSNDNRIRYNDGSFFAVANSVVTKTYENDFTLYQAQAVVSEGTVSNIVFQPMVYLASETDATFAPYTNICPISGLTSADVETEGKNLFDVSTYPFTSGYYINALENGDYVGGGADFKCTASFVPCSAYKGMTLTLNKRPGGWRPGIAFYSDDSEANFISGVNNNNVDAGTPMTFTVPSNANYMRFTVPVDADNIQIELGSTATPYEPYNSATATITFGQTVFGGTVDFKTGKVNVDRAIVEYDGSEDESWLLDDSGANYFFYIELTGRDITKSVVANNCESVPIGKTTIDLGVGTDARNLRYRYANDNSLTVSDLKTYLASNNLQICYYLATPTELTLTPAELELLKGNNTITANGATISLTYQPDNLVGEVMEQVDDIVDPIEARVATLESDLSGLIKSKTGIIGTTSANGNIEIKDELGNSINATCIIAGFDGTNRFTPFVTSGKWYFHVEIPVNPPTGVTEQQISYSYFYI